MAAAAPETLAKQVRTTSNLTGERRVVTILLVDIIGSTALSEQLGIETWITVMNEGGDQVFSMIYHLMWDA